MRTIETAKINHWLHCQQTSPKRIQGVSADSRTVQPGQLFVALKGERQDGHHFLKEVAHKGASAAIVSKHYRGPHYDLPLFPVEDPLYALQEIAKHILAEKAVRVVAITGSIGKTTTKEFTKTLLSSSFRVAASPGNSNSQVGLPLAILNHTSGEEDIVIFEMGMTHAGQITKLIQLAPPEIALVTKIALVHACNFNSIEEIAASKAEIFFHPHTKLGIFSLEDTHIFPFQNIGRFPKKTFSVENKEADYFYSFEKREIVESGKSHKLQTLDLPGKHNMYNLLAAISIARYFGVEWQEIRKQMSLLELPKQRLETVHLKGMIFLNDSYNASELSVKAALETLPKPERKGRKIAVLGSMMELGKFSIETHARVGQFALQYVDQIYCLGEECQPIYEIFKQAGKPVELFFNRKDLVSCLKKVFQPDDVILLKGSRSKELWMVLEEI